MIPLDDMPYIWYLIGKGHQGGQKADELSLIEKRFGEAE